MIRRELKLDSGRTDWLLISQVEHARVSGELARHWVADWVTEEVIAAIEHHDDGWASWEARPRIDPVEGRPYAFLDEMPRDETRTIWDGSIAAARQIGPLAGWIVAGHFSALLRNADHVGDPGADAWLAATDRRRNGWLREWLADRADHSEHDAKHALRLLQACDFLSLWLCRKCPVADNETIRNVEPFRFESTADGVGPIEFLARSNGASPPSRNSPFDDSGWNVVGAPWPFDVPELRLEAGANLVPIQRYGTTDELLDKRQPVRLHWRLVSSQ